MQHADFDVSAFLKYTEMVGEMACRFTRLSVLNFDDEYRKRQAAEGFAWGTEAPHLSTVVLRDRPPQLQQYGQRRTSQAANGQVGQRSRPLGASGRELCLQWNRGFCSYGARCNFEHSCTTCGKGHPSKDHPSRDYGASVTTSKSSQQ